jgi:hypothetical protein
VERNEQIELEIAAFQGPHIKRARIVLAVAGLLYVWTGYRAYDSVAKARRMIDQLGDSGPQLDQLHHMVNLAYTVVMSAIVAGVSMFVLAGIAGKKTMIAFYAAVAVFGVHTLILLDASDGLVFTDFVWWAVAICLTLGFSAARKADKLRAGA